MLCSKCKQEIPDDAVYCQYCGKKQAKTAAPKPLKRANGMGTVYKLSGRRKRPWAATINKKVIGYYAERTEALQALAAVAAKGIPDGFNLTLGDVYERFKRTEAYRSLSKNAKENYAAAWKRLLPQAATKMRDMKTAHFQQAIIDAVAAGVGRSSCEKIKTLSSLLCQNAMADDIIERNYADFLEMPKEKKNNRRNFTDEEVAKLFAHDDDDDVKIVLCLLYCGMRINEFLGLKKEDVSLEDGVMIGGLKTDAGRNRAVPIHPAIRPYIDYFYHKESPDGYLVCSQKGCKINYRNFLMRSFYPLMEKLEIQYMDEDGNHVLTPHRTRHTFVAHAVENKMSPDALMKIAGYAQYQTAIDKYDDDVRTDYLIKEMNKTM